MLEKNKIIFYKDTLVGKQIAYVLNIKYEFIDKITKKNTNNKIILFIDKTKSIKAKKLGLKYREDYIYMKDIYKLLNTCKYKYKFTKHNIRNFMYLIRPTINNIKYINKIPNEYLRTSEMLIKVLNSKPKNIDCNSLEINGEVDYNGDMWGCCLGWVSRPFGNILYSTDAYNDYQARILKLSSLNKTFCFCNFDICRKMPNENIDLNIKKLETKEYPTELTICSDKTCNLMCNSCRKKHYVPTKKQKDITSKITEKLINSDWLNKSTIVMAGQGEVFCSREYQKILLSVLKGKKIKLLTNGTLLNENNWKKVEEKYDEIYVSISIDAARKETYEYLRHGNYEHLMKNLKMLGELRKQNRLKYFQLNYVIQKDNYKEVKEFIELGKSINVDVIQFTKLNNWGTTTKKKYIENSLIKDNHLELELYELFKDPIFNEKIVNIEIFKELIDNSKKYYGDLNE